MAAAGSRALERLEFIVSLRDLVGERLTGLQRRITSFSRGVERGTARLKSAFIGAAAGVFGFIGALGPAIEHQRALREVGALGVSTENLRLLSQAGLKYSAQFGESATDFVRSAYDIQSAIADLSGEELTRFTTAANVTAKATRATAEDSTRFLGTMFGIFQQEAERMGRAEWVDLLAGRTAEAVRMFKTTGPELAAFFENLGAAATSAGLTMQEQLAIAGQLQATMGGSQAGTVFRNFLQNVGRAQQELGLSLTDARGRMLPVLEILERIRARFGAIDTVAKADLIKKAFGSDEAVKLVTLLVGRTGQLRGNIDALGRIKGIGPALQMAEAQVDPFQRLKSSIEALVITWGSFLLPIIQPFIDRLSAATAVTQAWAEQFPNLTKLIGLAAIALLGLIVGLATLQGLIAIFGIVSAGFALISVPMLLVVGILAGLTALVIAAILNWERWGPTLLAVAGGLAVLLAILFPIPAIIALIIAAVAAAVIWWDQLKAAIVAVAEWFDRLPLWAQVLGFIFLPFLAIPAKIIANWEGIKAWFADFWTWLIAGFGAAVAAVVIWWDDLKAAGLAALEALGQAWERVLGWIGGRWEAFTGAIRAGIEAITGWFERLIAPGSLLGRVAGLLGFASEPQATAGPLAARGMEAETLGGEARQAIHNAANQDNRRQQSINVQIKTEKMDLGVFERALNLAAQG